MKVYLGVLIFFLCVGCQREPERVSFPVLDFGKVIGKSVPDTVTWNSIAKRITYLPISNSSNTYLGKAQLVYIDENYYWVVDHKTNTIYQLDKSGKALNSFSRKGQGPGEYGMISYVHLNVHDSTLHVIDQRAQRYNVYDWKGNFIRDFSLKDKNIDMPLLVTDDYIVARGKENLSYKLFVTDNELNIEKSLFPLDTALTDMERFCLLWQVNFCKNRDQAIVHFADEDTVFSVTRNGVRPLCLIDKGQYKLPPEEAKKLMTPDPSPYIRGMGLSSISDYYLVTYIYENIVYDEVWSKLNNQIVSRFSNKDRKFGIPLHLPAGKEIRLNSRSLYIDRNIVAASIDAISAVEGGVPGVEEDDNPVLVIMEFSPPLVLSVFPS